MPHRPQRVALLFAVTLSGACGLTWEVLWQHQAALALGISSAGAAITLAALMGGLGLGGFLASRSAQRGALRRPLFAYAVAELVVGLGGWLAPHGFTWMAMLDTQLYASSPVLAAATRVLLTGVVLLAPAIALGATIPILVPYAKSVGSNVAVVYALNTLGAVVGVLASTFVVLPRSGVAMTATWTACLNVVVAMWAFAQPKGDGARTLEPTQAWPPRASLLLAAASGMAVFMLEVSWFRSMRAAFQSSTETFAVMLAAFLLCLSLGAWLAPRLSTHLPSPLWWLPALAALAVLASTPAVDRIDQSLPGGTTTLLETASRLLNVTSIVIAPIALLGMIFPLLLREHESTTGTGRLYVANTLGAVVGALAAGFLLLPSIGATHTSWLAALVIALAGVVAHPGAAQLAAAVVAVVLGGAVALLGADNAASRHVQGYQQQFQQLLHVDEGPDSTLWVTQDALSHKRALIIDGFLATSEGVNTEYMSFMGHLPALAAPRLHRALVICFGTGQTAYAVWQHDPARLDLVDVSSAVFDAASYFSSNHGVLQHANVHTTVMDGRAYLRRQTAARFDLVTLEPMPPNFAGVNNLYSTEFYRLVAARLSPAGVVAQWVPHHLLTTRHMRAIVASFQRVFPHTRLWQDPQSGTGILLGGLKPWSLHRSTVQLSLNAEQIQTQFVLDTAQLTTLVGGATPVTDDNQLLAYGLDRMTRATHDGHDWAAELAKKNHAAVRQAHGAD